MIKTDKSRWTLEKSLPWLLAIGGLVGLISAAILSVDYVNILKNPSYQPVCNLNPIFSCSNVMTTRQAHAFGIANEFIGLAGFAIILAAGIALLAKARPARWTWRLLNAGLLFAVGFITWLQFETLYRIGALCLFCMVVWAVTIPMFLYVTFYNLDSGHIAPPKTWRKAVNFLRRHHADILILWYLILIVLIGHRFWYYWKTL